MAGPPRAESPLGQGLINDEISVAALGDDRGRLHGTFDRRADDDRMTGKVLRGAFGLKPSGWRERKAREVGIDDVIWVQYLAVADEEDRAGPGVHLPEATGYGGAMAPFAEPILHVDMDSFFVEVERLDNPTLVDVPVAVGGTGQRGVIASASYEAREYGVRSAMPVGEARRRCPQLTVVHPEHGRYGEVSSEVFEIMQSITPFVEGISIDEAFLDVSGLRLHYPSVEAIGEAVRSTIRSEVGIPSSVGIAATKFVAKLASKHAKPNGLLRIAAGSEVAFLHPLDVSELWGVGAATRKSLGDLGIRTIGDVAQTPIGLLEARVGPAAAEHLSALSHAVDPRTVERGAPAQSVSTESTFVHDLTESDAIERETLRLCDQVSARLATLHLSGHTITLKVRFGDFSTINRSSRQAVPVAHTSDIWEIAGSLLTRAGIGHRPVRLLGVGVSDLEDAADARQLALGAERRDAAAEAVDEVRERFGSNAVMPARIVPRGSDAPDRPPRGR